MRFINESHKDSIEKPQVHPHEVAVMLPRLSVDPSHHVKRLGNVLEYLPVCVTRQNQIASPWYRRLKRRFFPFLYSEFQLSDQLKMAVSDARQRFDQMTGSLSVDLFIYEGFSKQFCKDQQVSPDAMMQLGFQVSPGGSS